jgi:hypothetical protein
LALAAATAASGGALAPVEAADVGAIFAAGATDVMTAEDAGLVADANGLFNVPLNSAFDFVAGAGLDGEVIASSAENNFARTSLDDLIEDFGHWSSLRGASDIEGVQERERREAGARLLEDRLRVGGQEEGRRSKMAGIVGNGLHVRGERVASTSGA